MKIERMTITPAIAADFLSKNTKNRPLSDKRTHAIANAIRNGEWMLNGDAIRFSESGELIDGQTRLSAIIRAGMPVDSLVIWGLPNESFRTIDINGSARTAGDVLAISGVKDYRLCATLAASVLMWEQTRKSSLSGGNHGAKQLTTSQIVNRVDSDALISDIARKYNNSKSLKRLVQGKVYGYVRYSTLRYDEEKSNSFFEKLESGADLSSDSPILQLRDYLARVNSSRSREMVSVIIAYMFLAFDLYCSGKTTKILRIWSDGNQKNIHKYQGLNYLDKVNFVAAF